MRKKMTLRLWFSRLGKYLVLPAALCAILFPLYSILHQQTIKAQLSDTSEQLAASVSVLEDYLYDIRYVTNKLFHNSNFAVLAAGQDDALFSSDNTLQSASRLLEDLTYNLSPVAYSYVTFGRNHLVVDDSKAYYSYESFYPATLSYDGMTLGQWSEYVSSQTMTCLPVQKVSLYQTSYPDSYLSVTQPFFDAYDRCMGSCTMLLREKQLISLFLPREEWRESGMFYIVTEDGGLLQHYQYAGSEPLEMPEEGSSVTYQGEEYLLVSREIPSLNATVVIGLPYEVYAEDLQTVNRAIWFYIAAGVLVCLGLCTVMTLGDMRYLRPMLDAMDQKEPVNSNLLERMVLQKLNDHNRMSVELDRTRNQIAHSRMDTLLKTGYIHSPADQRLLSDALALTQYNYLLQIPAPEDSQDSVGEELRLMLVAQQLGQCFPGNPLIHNAADGSVLAVLTLEEDTPEACQTLCRQAEELHHRLNLEQSLILSSRFSRLEQISAVYWQVRNAGTQPHPEVAVYCLSDSLWDDAIVPEIGLLERLSEALLAGQTESAQSLVIQMFGSEDLMLEDFLQIFYSTRGILLGVAEKVDCEDIRFLCTYDRRKPMKKHIQNLCECCFVIGSHVDAMKQSHNTQLQQSILQWMEDNFSRPDLNVAMVAEHFGISKKYVSQFLKDQTGKSYNEYLEELRLNHAMKLLRSTDLSITEVAVNCGFYSQNTFYKAFRRRFDLSPSAVRHGRTEG